MMVNHVRSEAGWPSVDVHEDTMEAAVSQTQQTRVNRLGLTVLFSVLLGLDQVTKHLAIEHLKGRPSHSYLGDLFRFQYAENPGAFLSLGAGLSDSTRFWIFTVMVALFLIGTIVYLFRTAHLHRLAALGLTLVTSGGFSNLLDRMFRSEGRVIDFMNIGVGGLRTGIFNIADAAILAGVGLMMIHSFFEKSDTKK